MVGDNLQGHRFDERSSEIKNLIKALMAFRRLCPKIKATRNNDITGSKYANLGDIEAIVNPLLLEQGLVITQLLSAESFEVSCKTVLLHESGEYISGILTITAHDRKAGTPSAKPMSVTAAAGYARRLGMSALLGLTLEEDRAEARDKRPGKPPYSGSPRKDLRTDPPPPGPTSGVYDRRIAGHLDFLSAWFSKHDIPADLYQEIENRLDCKPWSELSKIARTVMEEKNAAQGNGAGN